MKRKVISYQLIAVLALFTAGCATVLPGNDPILVNAQRNIVAARSSIYLVFQLERENEAYVMKYAPDVHKGVESLRHRAPDAIKAAWRVTETYRLNGSPNPNVSTAFAVLNQIATEAKGYLSQLPTNP